jgi:hypothetical protein
MQPLQKVVPNTNTTFTKHKKVIPNTNPKCFFSAIIFNTILQKSEMNQSQQNHLIISAKTSTLNFFKKKQHDYHKRKRRLKTYV